MSPPAAIVEVEGVTDTAGVTLPDPLSVPIKINEIYGRRRKTEKSQWGVAAPADSAKFKHHPQDHKPRAKRWDRRFFHPIPLRHCFSPINALNV